MTGKAPTSPTRTFPSSPSSGSHSPPRRSGSPKSRPRGMSPSSTTTNTSNSTSVRGQPSSLMSSSNFKSGASFLNPSLMSGKLNNPNLTSKMSMRPRRGGADKASSSGRRSRRKKKDDAARVFDKQTGRDVTPQPLVFDVAALSRSYAMISGTNMGEMDMAGMEHLLRQSGQSSEAATPTHAGASTTETDTHDKEFTFEAKERMLMDYRSEPKHKEWTHKELQEKITIKIEETETMTLLHIPGIRVWGEDEKLVESVQLANQRYKECIDKHHESKTITRHVQTFNRSTREKEVQAAPPATKDVGCHVTTWDIYDSYQQHEHVQISTDNVDDDDRDPIIRNITLPSTSHPGSEQTSAFSSHINRSGMIRSHNQSSQHSTGTSTMMSGLNHSSTDSSHIHSGDSSSITSTTPGTITLGSTILQQHQPIDRILRMNSFKKALHVIEQAVVQNTLHQKQLLYRHHAEADTSPEVSVGAVTYELKSDTDTDERGNKAHLIPLWSYSCSLTTNMNVSCLSWNRQNLDLLAAGYGHFDFGKNSPGLILFWSIKNPRFPQKIIRTKHSVTSLDFCTEHPHLLAAGLYDGSVAIYDIRDDGDKPALESQHATGKHSEPVWGVRWVTKESNKRGQQLTSISTDGSVQQWNMKKGLVPHELMQLKRIPNRAQFQGGSMEGMSREASGLCFDFPMNDGTQYFAGTEDGLIHKCSVSYNEQTLENFFGHTAPVYKLRCSPYLADAFISCSADWTSALWSQRHNKPVIRFQSGHDYVMDLAWCPANSCVFGSVSRDGRIEIWDMEESPLDPVIKHQHINKPLTCVSFSQNAPVILTGSSDGSIDLYRIEGVDVMNVMGMSATQQAARLENVIHTHTENKNKLAQTTAAAAAAATNANGNGTTTAPKSE